MIVSCDTKYKTIRCCSYGSGGNWNNGGGGGWNNGGYGNNKPGTCPSYNGRRKRSPEEAPSGYNGSGRHWGGGGWGNNGGNVWNGGSGSGFNPGYNNGWGNGNGGWNNGGRCIRDSECPGSLKCCYLYNGYQCTQPQYYG